MAHTSSRSTSEALAGWESEGGAQRASAAATCDDRTFVSANDDRILLRLGMAVILQWNSLPADIQRKLFAEAIAADTAADRGSPVDEQVARFLHRHKGDRAA